MKSVSTMKVGLWISLARELLTPEGQDQQPDRMATGKKELGLNGMKSVSKIPFARWVPMASLLTLLTILYFGRVAGSAEVSTRANPTNYANFQTALQDQMHAGSELTPEGPEVPKASPWQSLFMAVEIAVCMVLIFRLIVPIIGRLLDKRMNPATAVAETEASAPEKKSVAKVASEPAAKPMSPAEAAQKGKAILDEFFKGAPNQLVSILKLFAHVGRSTDPSVRQKFLEDLGTELTSLKNRVGTLELTPAWLLASCLEKLIQELREKPSNVSSPTLRTMGSGLLLLKDLCAPNVRKDLASEPPSRFLVVDDDLISRQAVSACLKKLGPTPDLAENGEEALKLAERQAYDAVFLDVEMPGLDGFEVCTKIHQLDVNRTAPVVFVTSHENYESRRKSNPTGKTDLIVKPFPASEITLKATVLLMRGRLDRAKPRRQASAKATASTGLSDKALPIARQEKVNAPAAEAIQNSESKIEASAAPAETTVPASELEQLTKTLRELKDQVLALNATENPELRQEFLNELYVGINLMRSEAARVGLKAVCELSSALAKLVSKLIDKPGLSMPSTYEALAAAIGLLEEIAQAGAEPSLANPVRALVVDDEPLARRAISNALQLSISKPDNAENGAAALALTQGKTFDVIFLDIMMPQMDGFETCSKIRQTQRNGKTPIVFVTSSKDLESREKAFDCGGNGFISKPVLPAEIFLTALTYTLRARMGRKTGTAEVLQEAIC